MLHASAVIWREDGLLIRGPAGAGKTTLALAVVAEAARAGSFSRLVADDRVLVRVAGGRLLAFPHPAIAGLVERRGLGVLTVDHEPACVVRFILDLVETPARLPAPETLVDTILGVSLPRLWLPRDAPATDNVYRARDFIAAFRACS